MPYSIDSDNLPERVKNMSASMRRLWVRTYNSFMQRKHDDKAAMKAADKMCNNARATAEGELENEVTDEEVEAFTTAESADKPETPTREYLVGLRSRLTGLKGKKIDDDVINRIMRQAAGSAGGKARAQAAALSKQASEIQEYRLLHEMDFAEPPDSINVLPVPGTYKHPLYGTIKITRERNKRFVSNFQKGVYQEKLPIDAEHQTKLSGAFGWMTKLKMNDDGSVDAEVEWTDRGKKALEGNRFKYFSPEWYDTWIDPATEKQHKDVLVGGAITTRPFFKDSSLKPLVASELELDEDWDEEREAFGEVPDGVSFDMIRESAYQKLREEFPRNPNFDDYCYISDMFADSFIYTKSGKYYRVPYEVDSDGNVEVDFTESKQVDRVTMWRPIKASEKIADGAAKDATIKAADKSKSKRSRFMDLTKGFTEAKAYQEMSDEDKLRFLEESAESILDQLEKAQQDLEAARTAGDDETSRRLQAAEARVEELTKTLRRQRFTALVRDGNWVGDVEGHVAMLETLADATGGEDSERVRAYIERENSLAEQSSKSELFSERGHSRNVTEQESEFQKALKAYREANPDATEAVAMAKIMEANPKFYAEYRQAMDEAAARGAKDIVSI